jgi:hypothetical protein
VNEPIGALARYIPNINWGFQSNFGPIQERDKWRVLLKATPEAALRVFYYLLRDQEVGGSNPLAAGIYLS